MGGAVVNPVFELPAQSTFQSAVDGIAILSSPTATIATAKHPMRQLPAPIALKRASNSHRSFEHRAHR